MTWVILSFLGLSLNAFSLQPFAPFLFEGTGLVDTWSIEYQMNEQEFQRQIIIEDYFTWVTAFKKIIYAKWCVWTATKCRTNAFDCWWLIKGYAYTKWIMNDKEIKYNNSFTLFELWNVKPPQMAERWDFVYFKRIGTWANHIAVAYSDYTGWTITIMDNMIGKAKPRVLKIRCNKVYCNYANKFKLYFANNWLVELANTKGILVDPFNTWFNYLTKNETWQAYSY